MEAVVNVVWAQPEKYGMDFDTTLFYLGQMVTKKSLAIQSVCIAKIISQPVRPKVVVFMQNVKYKKYPKAVWNFMNKEQKTQV